MADNFEADAGEGGKIFASDERPADSANFPLCKLELGDLDSFDGPVSSSNPMPVTAASLPLPSGASTAANQATGNADLSTIAGAVSGSEMQTDVVSSALPTGAATAANQLPDGHAVTVDNTSGASAVNIQDGGNSITVDGTITANAGTDLNTSALATESGGNLDTIAGDTTSLDGKVTACNTGDVTIGSELPAGTQNIGNVDILSVIPGTGATNLGKAEDSAHTTGDVGVMGLTVRQDADAALAADGDYVPVQTDDNGYLKVNIKAGAGSGGTASTDDSAFTPGSGSGTPMMGFATSDTVDSGDVGVIGMDTDRNLKISIEADNVGIGGGTQYTEDDAAAVNPIGTMAMAVRADSLAGVTGTDGDNIAVRSTNNGELYVKQTDAVPVTDNGGSLTVDGTVTANAGTNLNTSALATESGGNLDTIAGDTTSLDGKITACNTSAVVLATGTAEIGDVKITDGTETANVNASNELQVRDDDANTDLDTIAGDTTSIDGKITACNTGAVVLTNDSIVGPGDPTIDSFAHIAINLTTGTNQVLVSSAANKQIWIYGVGFTCGDADGQTVSFQDEDDTAITGIMEFAQYGGLNSSPSGNFAMPMWKLATDKDLEVDITGGDVDGWLAYAIVSV